MKLNFDWKNDGKYHQYCLNCHAETVERVLVGDRRYDQCGTCGQRHDRSIIIDPAIKWWVADDGEYWHESAGVFIRGPKGRFLFFERVIFPFAVTIPAGHVDSGETPSAAARREIEEEVGLVADHLVEITTDENIVGDSCSRGADSHRWNAYLLILDKEVDVKVNDEGHQPTWMTLDDALQRDPVYPVKYLVDKYRDALTADYPIQLK